MILVLGVLVFFGGIAMIIAQIRIRARAETAEGEVVEVEEIKSWSSNSQSPGSGGTKFLYRPTWVVRDGNGQRRIQSNEASSSLNVPLGTLQIILLDPANPVTGQLDGWSQFVWGVGVTITGAFVIVTDWLGLWS